MATLLDPILVSYSSNVFDSGVIEIPNNISEHQATFLYAPFRYIHPNVYKRKVWFYKRADYETLNNMILNHDWSFIVTHVKYLLIHVYCLIFSIYVYK